MFNFKLFLIVELMVLICFGPLSVNAKLRKGKTQQPKSVACDVYITDDTDGYSTAVTVDFGESTIGVPFDVQCTWHNGTSKLLALVYMNSVEGASILSNDCVQNVAINGSCNVTFRYTPGTPQYGNLHSLYFPTMTWFRYVTDPNSEGYVQGYPLYINFKSWVKATRVEPPRSCSPTDFGSIVQLDTLTFGESVPIVGTNFSLNYSSEFTHQYQVPYSNMDLNLYFNPSGWSVSLVHFYDSNQSRLFLGNGKSIIKPSQTLSDGTQMVVNGDEVYIFSTVGTHLRTKSELTGYTKYAFSYFPWGSIKTITDAFGNISSFVYDSNFQLKEINSPFGFKTLLETNISGLISRIVNPDGGAFEISYHPSTQLLKRFKNPSGNYGEATYDGVGRVTGTIHSGGDGYTYHRTETPDSIILTKRSALGVATVYNTGRDPVTNEFSRTVSNPDGSSEIYGETAAGSIYQSSTGNNSSSTLADERFGSLQERLSSISSIIGSISSTTSFNQSITGATSDPFVYSSITKATTRNGKTFSNTFTKSNRTISTVTPAGATSITELNQFEKVIANKIGNDVQINYDYDAFGRLSQVAQGADITTFDYGTNGLVSKVKNARNEETFYTHNANGKVAAVQLPDSRMVQYSYDLDGNLSGLTTPSNIVHSLTFNPMGLLEQYSPPSVVPNKIKDTIYSYNLDRKIQKIARPDGQNVQFTYNSVSGLVDSLKIGNLGLHKNFYSSTTGQLEKIDSFDNITNRITYHGPYIESETWRKTSDNSLYGAITYTYDSEHRLSSKSISGTPAAGSPIVTNYSYNNDDMPIQVGDLSLAYEYPSGRLSTTTLGKISDSRVYDSNGNLETYTSVYTPTTGSPSVLYSYTLTRDIAGRISGKTETILGTTDTYIYGYDPAGRLTTVTKDGAAYSSYSYDLNSNRVAGVHAGVPFNSTFDAQDRMLTYNNQVYTYNANGDVAKVEYNLSQTKTLRWDALGALRQVQNPDGKVISYQMDGRHNRAAVFVNGVLGARYMYESSLRIAANTDDSGVYGRRYTFATSINSPDYLKNDGSIYRIIKDHLGSPRLVVKSTDGTVVQRIDYSDLGKVTYDSSPGFQTYGFAGGIYDYNTDFVKFGAREYDGNTGRWLSKDPILFEGGDINLYGYVANDPINWNDPQGLRGAKLPSLNRNNRTAEDMQYQRLIELIMIEVGKQKQQEAEASHIGRCEYPGFSPIRRVFPAPLPPAPVPSTCVTCPQQDPL